jgi:ABC-type polar amino acid transport system ATPase subunit
MENKYRVEMGNVYQQYELYSFTTIRTRETREEEKFNLHNGNGKTNNAASLMQKS